MEGKALPYRLTMGKKYFLIPFFAFLALHFSPLFILSTEDDLIKKTKIMATVFPLYEMAKVVAGERGEVKLLLPPGAEVHTWQPRPSDMLKLLTADILIYVDDSLEPWLQEMTKGVSSEKLEIIEASRELIPTDITACLSSSEREKRAEAEVRKDEHPQGGLLDPHIWLDFGIDRKIVDRIEKTLSRLDPDHEEGYRKRAGVYKKRLEDLDKKYQKSLSQCESRTFIVGGHAAFGYLAHRYGLHQVALYGLSPDSKPSPRKITEVVKVAKAHRAKAIYFESFISSELASVIARETGAKILTLNTGATVSREEFKSGITFFEIMEKNLENLKHGLNCR